ncbi:MAG: minor capsid protein [Ramlibacter sp.]|nr:minor capsid protein [Ramlibacter sp.]
MSADDIGASFTLPPERAIAHLQAKQAQVTGSWREWLDGEHARAFTVANVAKLDVVNDIHESLKEALRKGETLQQWKDGLVPLLQRKGWWQREGTVQQLQDAGRVDAGTGEIAKGLTPHRLKTIFQTNMQSAYMAGRYAEMVEQAEDRPYWQYVAILDGRTRPAHRAMNGKTFRYDDPGWNTFYPPCGYNCRCRVRNFSQRDIDRRKIPLSNTEGKLREVRVPLRGGGSAQVTRYSDTSLPGGKFQPDPGFSSNPGLNAWQPGLEPIDTQLSRRYVETAVQGPAFGRFIAGQTQGSFPVAVLRPADQARLQAETSVAYLSSATVAKQAQRHPEVVLRDYQRIPEIVDEGDAHVQGHNRLVFLFEGDQVWRLALKATKGRDELYVLSLFRTSPEKAQREIRERLQRND